MHKLLIAAALLVASTATSAASDLFEPSMIRDRLVTTAAMRVCPVAFNHEVTSASDYVQGMASKLGLNTNETALLVSTCGIYGLGYVRGLKGE